MMHETRPDRPIGDEGWRESQRAMRRKALLLQGSALLIVALCLWWFACNVSDNLAARHIRCGFAFLSNAANFDIGETSFSFSSSDSVIRAFGVGIYNTVKVAVFSIASALVLGVFVGFMRLSAHPLVRALGTAHVEFYRNIPLIIQLFAIYMALTELLPMATEGYTLGTWAILSKAGLQIAVPEQSTLALIASTVTGYLVYKLCRVCLSKIMPELLAGVIGLGVAIFAFLLEWLVFGWVGGWSKPVVEGFAIEGGAALSPEFLALWLGLTLFTSASIAEIVRAGVLSVPQGQWFAGYSLGLSRAQTISYIVFPQSMRLAIPPLASQFMNLTKNSSLAVIIGYPDLVAVGNMSINVTGQALEVILIIMAVYLFLNLVISVAMNALNTHATRALQ